jgi:hypothetical protein
MSRFKYLISLRSPASCICALPISVTLPLSDLQVKAVVVSEAIRQEAVLLALASNACMPRRLDEQIFLSQLTCRAVLLNGGFQRAVAAVVASHLVPGFAPEYALGKPQQASNRVDNLPASYGFDRLPSSTSNRATLKPGWQTQIKQGQGTLSSDLTIFSGRRNSRLESRDMVVNARS